MRVEIKQIIKTETLILWDSQGKGFQKFPGKGPIFVGNAPPDNIEK